MVDEKDPSIFYTLSRQFYHELHYFKVGITHKRHYDTKKNHHQDSDIANTQFTWLLLYHGSWTNGRDPSIFYTHSEQFDHELHYFKLGHLPRSGMRMNNISSPRW
jgi:hypothetical protein